MSCAGCGEPSRVTGLYNCQGAGGTLTATKPCIPFNETSGPGGGKDVLTERERRKRTPVWSGVRKYFPDALMAIARVSWKGNEIHNPGQPLHWSRDKSTDHGDCVDRHLMTPDEIDPDSGETHLAHAAWRILALLQLQQEKLKEGK